MFFEKLQCGVCRNEFMKSFFEILQCGVCRILAVITIPNNMFFLEEDVYSIYNYCTKPQKRIRLHYRLSEVIT